MGGMRVPWLVAGLVIGLGLLAVLLPVEGGRVLDVCAPVALLIGFLLDRLVAFRKRSPSDPPATKRRWSVAPCLIVGALSGLMLAPPSDDAPRFILGGAAIGLMIGLALELLDSSRAGRNAG